ncbi:alternative oxidase [Terfezia boudieri ATCC MYA-4762]|uniref:Alternative oxidase n=1 Tax=Terfezia boudieri ATCC MYA-4762 TaxID=1051890 RepID=A0A3N4M1W1_9PEZI|nr:alternative oxidase [Terfezia boudieri ATCC MYA-4762]
MALCHISTHTITPAATLPLLRTAGHVYTFKQHQPFTPNACRQFSTAKTLPFEFFSSKRSQETKGNVQPLSLPSEPAWPHPVYTEKQMNDIKIAHRETKNWSDWVALSAVRILRWSFDRATGYKHDKQVALGKANPANPPKQYFAMTSDKWLIRFIFLESIAGVPGMVGAMLRHLHSLRKLRRDNGWIETLLEEAYNERMHLLTFLKLRNPGWFMRFMILGAQGVFFNGFFLSYLISPRTCHRFVGYLEEEAVITYTRAIADIDAGKIPEWNELPAPDIAINYWQMKKGATMRDLLNYVRADEAKHREVNHTLANLAQEVDPNPFLIKYEVPEIVERPVKGLQFTKPTGWDREEVLTMASTKTNMPM